MVVEVGSQELPEAEASDSDHAAPAPGYKAVVSGEAMTPGPPGTEFTVIVHHDNVPNAIRWGLVVFLVPAILYHLVMSIYLTIEFLQQGHSAAERNLHVKLLSSSLSIEGLVNVILSIGLCVLIWRLYPRSDEAAKSRSTISMVRRLMFISILTGIWTAAFGVLCMATVLKYPTNHIHISFCFIISPVYCVMLLANLNARAFIREGVSVVNFDSSGVSGLSLKDLSYRSRRSMATTTNQTERTGTTMAAGSTRDSKMVHVTIETSTHPSYDDRDIKDDLIQSPV
ncbi:hypothetical protein MD484_g5342, partial [Candolleomyces efflorescens]